jgi:DNA-binding response OmpR family regulator
VDGYLLKPVEPGELRQAVQEALDRRQRLIRAPDRRPDPSQQAESGAGWLEQGPFAIDLKRHQATMNGQSLDLTPREFTLLVYLIQNADRTIPPQELVQVVRDYKPIDVYEARDIVKWYIYRLRRKIEPDPAQPRYVVNVRGVGYRFGE